jgi:membrane-associated protein
MNPLDFILHIDKYLKILIMQFGVFIYIILFAIVFIETGLVVFPFLPGDSLLFVSGTLAGTRLLNIFIVYPLFLLAAISGDSVNYWVGSTFGLKVLSKYINKDYLERTKKFYKEHGASTIVLARFLPIIRTFAPFVAGLGKMHYGEFIRYNIIGGFAWVTLFLFAGYFFGKIPFVENNLTPIVLVIIVVSMIPAVLEFMRHKLAQKKHAK